MNTKCTHTRLLTGTIVTLTLIIYTSFLSSITIIRYHFLHSLALFTAQFATYPMVTASLFILGQLTFCGGGYMFAVFDEHEAKKYSVTMPIGGFCFIFGWLSHIL